MPKDEEIKWTPQQEKQIDDWLQTKWGNPPRTCPYCQVAEWVICPPGNLPAGDQHSNMHLGRGFPSVVLICGNCGNTVLINALLVGVVVPKKEDEANG